MIVLTGDVHHWSLRTNDQRHSTIDEVEASRRWVDIAERHHLRTTLFVTGLATVEHRASLEELVRRDGLELAGHTWDGFRIPWWKRPRRKLSRSAHGPRQWQRTAIGRTLERLGEISGALPRAWRNHAYLHDDHTPGLLREAGIRLWSDRVDPTRLHPWSDDAGLLCLPINTMPDHEHVYHGHRTPEWVRRWLRRYRFQDAFGAESWTPARWARWVADQADRVVAAGGVATILAHPLCQHLADGFRAFEWLCKRLSAHPTVTASQLIPGDERCAS